jgi:hypothetical protein
MKEGRREEKRKRKELILYDRLEIQRETTGHTKTR